MHTPASTDTAKRASTLGRFKRDALMLSMDDQPPSNMSDQDSAGITIVNPKMVVVMVRGQRGEAPPSLADEKADAQDDAMPATPAPPSQRSRYGQ